MMGSMADPSIEAYPPVLSKTTGLAVQFANQTVKKGAFTAIAATNFRHKVLNLHTNVSASEITVLDPCQSAPARNVVHKDAK